MIGLFRKTTISPRLAELVGDRYNEHELRQIDRSGTRVNIDAGSTFAIEGARGREVLLILEGTAAVSRDGEMLATVGTGDFVGELSVLLNQPRNATVMATTPLTAIVFTSLEFVSLLADCPRLDEQVRAQAEKRIVA